MIDWEPGEMQFHDSVDEFLDAVVAPDPDGSKRASRLIEDDMGLTPRPAWYEAIEASELRDRSLRWLANRNVILFALAAVGFWVALWWTLT